MANKLNNTDAAAINAEYSPKLSDVLVSLEYVTKDYVRNTAYFRDGDDPAYANAVGWAWEQLQEHEGAVAIGEFVYAATRTDNGRYAIKKMSKQEYFFFRMGKTAYSEMREADLAIKLQKQEYRKEHPFTNARYNSDHPSFD